MNTIEKQLSIRDFRKVEIVGEGSFGKVWQSINKNTGDEVAIKEIKLRSKNKNLAAALEKSFQREIKNMSLISHKNVLKLHTSFRNKNVGYLVLDLMPVSLKELLGDNQEGLDLDVCKQLCFQLLRAVKSCHKRRIVHRDIKPGNLLLTLNGTLKLADFGLSKRIRRSKGTLSEAVGTTPYMSPEILQNLPYGMGTDVWSTGCVFLQMVTGQKVFKSQHKHEVLAEIYNLIGTPVKRTWPSFKGKKTLRSIQGKNFEQVFPKLRGNFDAIDAAKFSKRLVVISKFQKPEPKLLQDYDGLTYCNYVRSCGIPYKIDESIKCEVMDSGRGTTFETAVREELLRAEKKCIQDPLIPPFSFIISRLNKIISEMIECWDSETISRLHNEGSTYLNTLKSFMLMNPITKLFDHEIFNATSYSILHQIKYIDEPVVKQMCGGKIMDQIFLEFMDEFHMDMKDKEFMV